MTETGASLEVQALPPLNFPQPLQTKIAALPKDAMGQKKLLILNTALQNYVKVHSVPASVIGSLPNAADYTLKPGKDPGYFVNPWVKHPILPITHRPDYYDYSPDGTPNIVAFWLDFANAHLGGEVFRDGFVQEEIMCCETPDLANAAAIPNPQTGRPLIHTRSPDGAGVLEGSPTPVAILSVNRVLQIDTTKLYGRLLASASLDDVNKALGLLSSARTYNVLAAAAPKLGGEADQYKRNTLNDLFNTFVAAFQLAKNLAGTGKHATINTGPIGCGDFKNSPYAVYVLQGLAAELVDVNLHFWGYSDAQAKGASDDYAKIKAAFDGGQDKTVNGILDAAWKSWGSH